jgi:polyribonucleotide nucleotidyltransferase
MDTKALADLMRSREETTSRELTETLAEAQRLNSRVAVLRGRLTKRPSTPLGAVDDKLRALELRRVTSSLTLQEEKSLLKEIERVRASKKEHALVDAERAEIDALKAKADAAFGKVGLMRDSLSELRAASKTLQLCVQIQELQGGDAAVMPNDLETRTLAVPDSSVIGQIIGRGGANIKRFRSKHGVVFDTVDEDGETVAIKLTGLPESLDSAIAELTGIINAVSKETSVSAEVLNALMMDRASRLHQLQDRWAVQVEPSRRKNGGVAKEPASPSSTDSKLERVSVKVRGGEEAVDACIAALATFEAQAGEVSCASEYVSAVVGSKAIRLIELQNEFSAYVSIDRDAAVFRIFHEDPAQISACAAKLGDLVEEYRQREEEVAIDPEMAPSVIGKGGANIQQLQKETKCYITVDREDRGRVIMRGTKAAIAVAKEKIEALCDTFAKEHQTVQFPVKLVGILIARMGDILKKLEKEHGVRINVNRNDGVVKISGPEDSVTAAKASLAEIEESCCEESLDAVTAEEIGMVIGKSGATIRRLTSTHKCEINVNRDASRIEFVGIQEHVNAARTEVEELVMLFRKENIELDVDPLFLPSFIGKGGEHIKKFRDTHKVDVSLGPRGSGGVKVRGKEELVQAAKDAIVAAEQFWKDTNATLPVQKSQIDLLIGHKGETIKKLQVDSGCSIDLRRKELVARIRGDDPAKVKQAVEMVKEIIGVSDDWVTQKIPLPVPSASSFVVGRGGETIRRLQKEHHVAIDLSNKTEEQGFVSVSGLADKVQGAVEEIAKILHENVRYFKRLCIDAAIIPSFIGRRGDNIRHVQNESGADIEVRRPSAGASGDNGDSKSGRTYQNVSPLDPDDTAPLDPTQAYVIVRGSIDTVRLGLKLVRALISSLRYDQVSLKPHHMSSLKQQQSGKLVQVELHFDLRIRLDPTANTVTFEEKNGNNNDGDSNGDSNGAGHKVRALQAWGEVHKVLGFFHPKEFGRVDIPTDLSREIDRGIPEMRIKTGAKLTLINAANSTVLVMGDDVQVAAAMEALQAIKAAYLKNARDVRIPVDLIPQVIGKGGKGIQDLQSTHDVRINIDKMDRGLVHLRGETEGLDSAVEALLAMKVAHEARTRTLEFDQEATGILVGRGGSTIRQLQSDFNVRIDINSSANPAQARVRGDGDSDTLNNAVEAMKKLLEDAGYGENVTTEDMPIAREHIGSVVGEAGSVVRQLEDDSKCQIRIRKEVRGGIVSIRGNPDAIEMAKARIVEIIAERELAEAARLEELQQAREEAAAIAKNRQHDGDTEAAVDQTDVAEAIAVARPDTAPRYIPGAGAQWNKEAEEGFSMSSTAQKNRRKRERRKAAAKSNQKREHAKQESYQQNLQQLLFEGGGGGGGLQHLPQPQQPAPIVQQQQQQQMVYSTNNAPPGFERPSRSPPPGFEHEALMKLADLGFGSSISTANLPQGTAVNNNAPAAMYVSSRRGYKLRL